MVMVKVYKEIKQINESKKSSKSKLEKKGVCVCLISP